MSVLKDRAMLHTAKQKMSSQPHQKKKVTVTGDSMLNWVSEKDLSRAHNVKATNFPVGTSDKIVEKLNDLIKDKSDDLVIHIGTNELTNNGKLLNNVKKLLKIVSANAPSTNLDERQKEYREIHSRYKYTLKNILHAKRYWIY